MLLDLDVDVARPWVPIMACKLNRPYPSAQYPDVLSARCLAKEASGSLT